MLVLGVADTGRGLVAGSGGGTGLANIRARLKAMYGAAAGLSLRLNEPRGVVAEIKLPAQAACRFQSHAVALLPRRSRSRAQRQSTPPKRSWPSRV